MNGEFRILPEAASEAARQVDQVSLALLGIGTLFSVGIAIAIVALAVRYWHTRDIDRSNPGGRKADWALEFAWSITPLLILMVMFWWGADVFMDLHEAPSNPLEISVVAKQWMWKVGHPGGAREINTLHVPTGRPVRLTMISQDVIHSFYVPAFRNKQDVLPGRYTTMNFYPTKTGTYHLFCAEYCGTDHSLMKGTVVVQTASDYLEWQSQQPAPAAAERGRRLLDSYGCLQCHGNVRNPVGPPLTGLFNQQVPLADGSRVSADAAYIRRSILEPQQQVHAGFQPVMPSFQGKLDAEQILDITAYLRSVADAAGPLAGPGPDTDSAAAAEQEGN